MIYYSFFLVLKGQPCQTNKTRLGVQVRQLDRNLTHFLRLTSPSQVHCGVVKEENK